MLNPSYLIRTRHAIFYFRYPIAQRSKQRVSISLGTRCPNQALRYAKALEYHAFMAMDDPKMQYFSTFVKLFDTTAAFAQKQY